ncbi:YueI family protein [Sediminibacillus albus]|uniref:Uncharacterized protein YueI n=1 Tax=Sediminibacillus albus TaxID=407036 RepID=A0A1G9AL94_9BACI|nr:YueI family protein [Sediminibacillus albus]SDK28087.1 Uncharacterized protein YueI [Sediminibacillus albus]
MSKRKLDDYIEEGIYGAKQTNPAERKHYLGTLRERVIIALKKSQVMQQQGLAELEAEMKNHSEAKLLFNGNISSRFLKKYKKLSAKYRIQYTSVTNKEAETDIGAILTSNDAIEREAIFIESNNEEKTVDESEEKTKGFKHAIKKIFGLTSSK